MSKKLISKCCGSEVEIKHFLHVDGEYYKCLSCQHHCEVIEEPIPQPIQKEEEEMLVKCDRCHQIKTLGKVLEYPKNLDNGMNYRNGKGLCVECSKEVYDKTPTPSDTFIEEKMKEFDNLPLKDIRMKDAFQFYDPEKIKNILKSSLQLQREAIEKEFTDKLIKLLAESESLETTKEIRTRIKDLII